MDFEDNIWDRDYEDQNHTVEEYDVYEYESDDSEKGFVDNFVDEITSEEVFEQQESVMDNARIRLEQGRLYEMLIKHDLFDGVDADPQAINNVQKEIREFIIERLEILLGMRAEKTKEIQQIIQQPQFNDVEVQALKMIANKVTNGASAKASTTPPVTNELNVVKKQVKQQKINALSSVKKSTPPPLPVKQKQPEVVVQKQPLKTSPKQKLVKKLKKEFAETKTEGLNANQLAQKDINYLNSLQGKTLTEANEIVSQRHKRPVPKNTTLNNDAVNAHYQTKVALNNSANSFLALLQAAKKIE